MTGASLPGWAKKEKGPDFLEAFFMSDPSVFTTGASHGASRPNPSRNGPRVRNSRNNGDRRGTHNSPDTHSNRDRNRYRPDSNKDKQAARNNNWGRSPDPRTRALR